MLSYRHGFHAGNPADVLKHAVLAWVAHYLATKPRPLLYLDTHAGAGRYDLHGELARKTGEAERGIARLWQTPTLPALFQPYLSVVRQFNPHGTLRYYPGSPLLAARLLRPIDQCVLYERHATDYVQLAALMLTDRRLQVHRSDGLTGLRAQLPPVQRRGLILIDPSWEQAQEYRALPAAVADALQRFATGVYLLWYPLLDASPRLCKRLANIGAAKTLWVELRLTKTAAGRGLKGSGLVLFNPPWGLEAALREALPWLSAQLESEASADCRWYLGNTPPA